MIVDTAADMVTSVEAQNMDVSSASVAVDTVKISPVLNYITPGNQKRPDQERTDPRLSKPCRIKGISDEGMKFILKRICREERQGSLLRLSLLQRTVFSR